MTTASPPAPPVPPVPALARPARFRPLFADLVRAEWTKLVTVRSTYWMLLVTAFGMVGFGALLTAAYASHYAGLSASARAAFDLVAYTLSGFFVAQLAVGVLGVVVMTSEYATGSIRATFGAAPQRPMVLAAKAAVFGAAAAAAGIISSAAAFTTGQAILSRKGRQAHPVGAGAFGPVIGAGLYLAVTGLLALGLGALIRRTAGAIAVLVGVILVLPVFVQGLPSSWQDAITRYLPSATGQAVIGRTKFAPPGHLLAPWAGFALYCGYAVAVLLVAAVTLNSRDA
jgi:ABC-2 type transport system permease protein